MPNPWDELPDAPQIPAPEGRAPWADLPDAEPAEAAPPTAQIDSGGDVIMQRREAAKSEAVSRRPSSPGMGMREELSSIHMRPEDVRAGAGVGAGIATLIATKNLPLSARVAAMGGGAALTSLLSETFDPSKPEEHPPLIPQLGPPMEERSDFDQWFNAAGQRALGEGARGALGELLFGAPAAKGLGIAERGALRGPADPVRDMAVEAIERGGGVLPPAQATGSNAARLLQSFAESSAFGAPRLQAARKGAEDIAQRGVQEFAERIPLRYSREELGTVIQDALEGRTRAFMDSAHQAYGRVDEAFDAAIQDEIRRSGAVLPAGQTATAEPVVSLGPLRKEAQRLLSQAEQGLPGGEASRILRQVMEKPERVTFQSAARLRSDLLRVTRSSHELIAGQARAAAQRLSRVIDDAMESSAKAAGPQVEEAWRVANQGYKAGAQTFNSKLVRDLAGRQPEAVVDGILRSNKPGSVRLARKAIGDEQVWRSLQREYVERLMTRDGIDAAGQVLKGQKMLTQMRRFGESGRELLGAPQHAELEKLAQVLQTTQELTGKGAGGLSMRAVPEGLALSLLATGRPGIAASVVIPPIAIGHLFTNPTTVRILTRGFRAPAGSREALRAFGQIGAELAQTAYDAGGYEDQQASTIATDSGSLNPQ